jgi:AcrR family transcriptional regulator
VYDDCVAKYTLKRRAEKMDETRQRIAQAVYELHSEIGPARATVSAIARRAGVQRETVYRHFPDDLSLYRACLQHWSELHPWPDPNPWKRIAAPEQRLRTALVDVYRFYRRVENLFALGTLDLPKLPKLQEADAALFAHFAEIRRVLSRGWGARGMRRARILAAVGLALDFTTWYTLTSREGLDDEETVDMMLALVRSART